MKLWKYVLIGIMGVFLVGCGNSGNDGKNKFNKSVENKTLNSKSEFL